MRDCNEDEIAHRDGGTFDFDVSLPATQAGSKDAANIEVEFSCCTNQESIGVAGSPVCPMYS